MKIFFRFIVITFCCVVMNQASYGVYLEYEDHPEGGRIIRVDFRDLETLPLLEKKLVQENGRRISRILEKTGLSFTETTTICDKKSGCFTYTRVENNFFKSTQVYKFIEWIEGCDYLRKLEFIGVNTIEQIASVKQAFLRLIERQASTLEEDFVLVPDDEPMVDDLMVEDKDASPLIRIVPSVSLKTDMLPKFKQVLVTCTGRGEKAVKKTISRILNRHKPLFSGFIIE